MGDGVGVTSEDEDDSIFWRFRAITEFFGRGIGCWGGESGRLKESSLVKNGRSFGFADSMESSSSCICDWDCGICD